MNRVDRCLNSAACALALALASACGSTSVRAVAAPQAGISDEVADLCAGVPEPQRERPYFLRASGIETVRELTGEQRFAKFAKSEIRGAEIAVRPAPQETRQRVARMLRCHMAWQDTMLFSTNDGFEDPLRVGQPNISFDQTERGLVIRIAGHDKEQGEEILRRAEALLAPTATARN
jgi:hypothetical protein